MLPHVKITELLMEVDDWTGFTRQFTHRKSGDMVEDRTLRLSTLLADDINLGLTKLAESCPGATYANPATLHGHGHANLSDCEDGPINQAALAQ